MKKRRKVWLFRKGDLVDVIPLYAFGDPTYGMRLTKERKIYDENSGNPYFIVAGKDEHWFNSSTGFAHSEPWGYFIIQHTKKSRKKNLST